MRLRILIVSSDEKRKSAIAISLIRGFSQIKNAHITVLCLASSLEEAVRKIEEMEITMVICDSSLKDWRDLIANFRKIRSGIGGSKFFLLFYPSESELASITQDDMDSIDGFFCSKSFKEKSNQVCQIIADLLSLKTIKKKIIC